MCAKKKKPISKKKSQPEKVVKQVEPTIEVDSKPAFKAPIWMSLVFIGLAFLLYQGCISYGYVLDDKIVFTENDFTKKGISGIKEILTTDSFFGYFGEQKDLVGGRYRPLSLVTFAIEYELVGLNPKVAHSINILLYGLCAWLVFLVMGQMVGKKNDWMWSIPFLTALIYLVHPVHTEAVANIKGRDELMAMIFGLLTLRHCLKFGKTSNYLHLILAGIFYFLGILSKENVITFLAVVPLAMWMFSNVKISKVLTVFGFLFALSLIYLFTRHQIFGYIVDSNVSTDIMNNPFFGMTKTEKFGSISYTMYEYLRLSFIPHPLTHDYYPYHIPKVGFGHWKVVAAIVLHLVLLAYSVLAFKKHKVISFGIWFYIITISIVSNIVVGVGTFMNERFIFISSMGVCMILAYILLKGSEKWNPKIFYGIAAAIVLLYGTKTMTRVPAWESALTLNQSAVKVSKRSARANSFMATALFNQSNEETHREKKLVLLQDAKIYADNALVVIPTYSNGNLMKAGVAAELYKLNGDLAPLLQAFKEVAEVQPQIGFISEYCEYLNGRADGTQLLNFYYDLGYNTLFKKNVTKDRQRYNWAVHYLNFGYSLDSSNPNIRKALFDVYTAAGNPQKAQEYR